MQIETLPINTLKPSVYNPRIMPEDEMRKLGKSLAEFGVVEPIVINKNNSIIGGHMRIEALKTAGITEVPCVRVDIDPIKEKALNLALNKIHGEFEMPMLKDVLEEIDTGELEDIEITGFDEKEQERLVNQFHVPEEEPQEPTDSKTTCPECGAVF